MRRACYWAPLPSPNGCPKQPVDACWSVVGRPRKLNLPSPLRALHTTGPCQAHPPYPQKALGDPWTHNRACLGNESWDGIISF